MVQWTPVMYSSLPFHKGQVYEALKCFYHESYNFGIEEILLAVTLGNGLLYFA